MRRSKDDKLCDFIVSNVLLLRLVSRNGRCGTTSCISVHAIYPVLPLFLLAGYNGGFLAVLAEAELGAASEADGVWRGRTEYWIM